MESEHGDGRDLQVDESCALKLVEYDDLMELSSTRISICLIDQCDCALLRVIGVTD